MVSRVARARDSWDSWEGPEGQRERRRVDKLSSNACNGVRIEESESWRQRVDELKS
jgi:hypothetical protein